MSPHGVVGTRPVPVHRVQDLWWWRVRELKESAGVLVARRVAPHQRQRDPPHGRTGPTGLHEGPLEILVPEIGDRRQGRRSTGSARAAVLEMHSWSLVVSGGQCA